MALAVVVFLGGVQVGRTKVFPYELLQSARRTALTLYDKYWPGGPPYLQDAVLVDLPPSDVGAARIAFHSPNELVDRIVFPGGVARFAELCPGHPGCIAVEYVGQGQVARAYPYRPRQIEEATIVDLPYEHILDFRLIDDAYVFAVDTYPNGDLLVVFHFRLVFPYGGGVARVRPDGTPAWYRRDYSRHEPHIAADDAAWVPGLRIGKGPLRVHYEAPKENLGFELSAASRTSIPFAGSGPTGSFWRRFRSSRSWPFPAIDSCYETPKIRATRFT